MTTHRLLILTLVLAVSTPGLAKDKERVWTDSAGVQTEAEFVRVHEGKVILRRGNRMLTVTFDGLSAADQQYVRDELAAKGQSHLLPSNDQDAVADAAAFGQPGEMPAGNAAAAAAGSPAADRVPSGGRPGRALPPAVVAVEPSPASPGSPRVWKDQAGRQLVAEFVGVDGNQVTLMKDGRRVPCSFGSLSPVDQQYVRNELLRRGQGDLIPKLVEQPAATPTVAEEPPALPAADLRMPGEMIPAPSIVQPAADAPSLATETAAPPAQHPARDLSADSSEMTSATPAEPFARDEPLQEASAEQPPATAATKAAEVSDFSCGNCNEPLPFHFSLGQRCPNCKARVMYEAPAGGPAARADNIELPRWWLAIGGVGGLFAVAAAFLLGGGNRDE